MDVELSDYVAGGYLVVRYGKPWQTSPGIALLPDRLISLSPCIGSSLQVFWGWHIEETKYEAMAFGIPEDRLHKLVTWSRNQLHVEVDHPNVFLSPEFAQNFVAQFLPSHDDIAVIGVGLHQSLVETFLQENPQTIYNANTGEYHHDAKYGLNRLLDQPTAFAPGGEILGFELVGYEINFAHSWLCNYLEHEMHKQFGIRPNQYGLIDTYADAKKVYEWIAEDEQRGHRAEPEPYYPWLLVQYPIE